LPFHLGGAACFLKVDEKIHDHQAWEWSHTKRHCRKDFLSIHTSPVDGFEDGHEVFHDETRSFVPLISLQ